MRLFKQNLFLKHINKVKTQISLLQNKYMKKNKTNGKIYILLK